MLSLRYVAPSWEGPRGVLLMDIRLLWAGCWKASTTSFLTLAALNMSVFLLIGRSSALTMNVAGVIKDWMLIGLSVMMFKWVSTKDMRARPDLTGA
jgi:hypothetical protein